MDSPKQIVEGFTNLAKAKMGIAAQELEDFARKRFDSCKSCADEGGPGLAISSTCNDCKCFMPAKVRVPEAKCPKGRW